jgi:hypothetical protein
LVSQRLRVGVKTLGSIVHQEVPIGDINYHGLVSVGFLVVHKSGEHKWRSQHARIIHLQVAFLVPSELPALHPVEAFLGPSLGASAVA